jgi:hypothetical protein
MDISRRGAKKIFHVMGYLRAQQHMAVYYNRMDLFDWYFRGELRMWEVAWDVPWMWTKDK